MLLAFRHNLFAACLASSTLAVALPDDPKSEQAPAPAPAPAPATADEYIPWCAPEDPNVPFAGWDLSVRPYCEESYVYFYNQGVDTYTAYRRGEGAGTIPAPTYYSYNPCAFTFKLDDYFAEDTLRTEDAVQGAVQIANLCHYFGRIQISEGLYVELNDSVKALKDAAANGDPVFPFQYPEGGRTEGSVKLPAQDLGLLPPNVSQNM